MPKGPSTYLSRSRSRSRTPGKLIAETLLSPRNALQRGYICNTAVVLSVSVSVKLWPCEHVLKTKLLCAFIYSSNSADIICSLWQVGSKANRAIIARLGYIVLIWLYRYDPIWMWKFKICIYETECSCFWKVASYVYLSSLSMISWNVNIRE